MIQPSTSNHSYLAIIWNQEYSIWKQGAQLQTFHIAPIAWEKKVSFDAFKAKVGTKDPRADPVVPIEKYKTIPGEYPQWNLDLMLKLGWYSH
jgi:hypothetical protein